MTGSIVLGVGAVRVQEADDASVFGLTFLWAGDPVDSTADSGKRSSLDRFFEGGGRGEGLRAVGADVGDGGRGIDSDLFGFSSIPYLALYLDRDLPSA